MGNKTRLGVLSLFIAAVTLGVYGNADARIRRDEVRTEHIRDGEVRNQDIGNNAVTTDKIADGGVQNADIGHNAVTTDKFAPGAVDNADLGANSVTTDKIAPNAVNNQNIANSTINSGDIADGAVTTPKIAGGAVTGAKVADGAIMDAHISSNANISPSKFAPGTFSSLYDQVINVSTDGNGNFTDPIAALASITDNSVNTTYLLKIMPGVYNIGANSLQMKPYVDIEGCGEYTTKITGNMDSPISGTVNGADNAELRLLTVENTGGGVNATAISNSSASPKITQVTAIASGGANTAIGIYNIGNSLVVLTNVTARASGAVITRSICNSSGAAIMNNVNASASGSGGNYGVYNTGLDASPTIINNVTATASGGNSTFAIYNDNASPTITNVTATASGGSSVNYGVFNNSSSPVMTDVIASASGGDFAYGVYNQGSYTSMTNVTTSASGGSTASYGVKNQISGTVTIDRSVISGTTNTVWNDGANTKVAHTRLDGGNSLNSSGTLTCAGIYDETYTFFTNSCP